MPMRAFSRAMRLPRFGITALALAGAGLALPASAAVFSKPGTWEMAEASPHRLCRLVLRTDAAEAGLAIGMPSGCRRAFPILAKVTSWMDAGDAVLRFADAGGQPVLNFEASGDAFAATGPEGEAFTLQPVEPARKAALAKLGLSAADAAGSAAMAGQASPAVATIVAGGPAAAALKPSVVKPKPAIATVAAMAGHYAVLRDKTHDTGCMVTLDEKVPGPKATLKARLAPACRDQGIIIFDPVGWSLEGGRLVLMARKGHTTHLDPQDDGSWMKDPTEGKSLSLKKM